VQHGVEYVPFAKAAVNRDVEYWLPMLHIQTEETHNVLHLEQSRHWLLKEAWST
jgi:hypothetical protein